MSSRRVLLATIALVAMACDEEHAASPIVTDPPFDTTAVSSTIDARSHDSRHDTGHDDRGDHRHDRRARHAPRRHQHDQRNRRGR